jgi:type IV pilus assembly protein PilO
LEKFNDLPMAQKLALLVLIMAGLGAAWYFMYYDETKTEIAKANGQTQQLSATLADEQEIEKNLARYKAEIDELRAERDKMRDRLPDNAEIADLLEKIHSQAKITGLEIAKFEKKDAVVESMYARIPVNMQLRGTFQEISTFFYYLGRLTRIVNIENIELKSGAKNDKDRESKNILLASCTATTFMYVAEGAAVAKGKKSKKKAKKKGGH